MRRLIIHIGRQKSGTSALQYFLNQNESFLKNESVIYPQSGREGKIAHHHIAILMKEEKYSEIKSILNLILEETSTFNTVIISSEAFQNVINLYPLEQIIRYFNQVQVICYLRESLSYLLSAYKQKVQAQNYTDSIDTFLKSARLDYKRLVNRWQQLDENIIVRLYEKQSLINQNIIDDFFDCLNLNLPSEISRHTIAKNTSLGSSLVLYKLIRNKLNLAERKEYQNLEKIAGEKKAEQAELFIPAHLQNKFREKDKNNDYLKELFGTIQEKDFSKNSPWVLDENLEADFKKYNQYFELPVPLDKGLQIAKDLIAQMG